MPDRALEYVNTQIIALCDAVGETYTFVTNAIWRNVDYKSLCQAAASWSQRLLNDFDAQIEEAE